ncbi:MAG: hypothetical protein E7Z91_02005 [Cyanobacteria bacterium SIG30]|nr:hypothetical protein [Cyanobacteria bacterium SIG30]
MTNLGPKINLFERIEPSKLSMNTPAGSMRMKSIEQPESADFKTVLSGLVENLNNQANAPDQVLNDAVMGNADVHEVMSAIQKSDIQVTIATTVVGKVIQTYEKISQIAI